MDIVNVKEEQEDLLVNINHINELYHHILKNLDAIMTHTALISSTKSTTFTLIPKWVFIFNNQSVSGGK